MASSRGKFIRAFQEITKADLLHMQREYNWLENQYYDSFFLRTRPMPLNIDSDADNYTPPALSTYSTEELRRLTTLTTATAVQGEYIRVPYVTVLKTRGDAVDDRGWGGPWFEGRQPLRRVRSFTDPTELDPGQESMAGELRRRDEAERLAGQFTVGQRVRFRDSSYRITSFNRSATAATTVRIETDTDSDSWALFIYDADPADLSPLPTPRFKQGDVVVRTGLPPSGHLATVTADVSEGNEMPIGVRWDRRVETTERDRDAADSYYSAHFFRLATPADIAAFEARVEVARPKPQLVESYKAGDVVVCVAAEADVAGETGRVVEVTCYTVIDFPSAKRWYATAREIRPATDAEIAAYHKAHCGKTPQVPEPPKPVVVSNWEHAGRRVRWAGSEGVVMDNMDAKALFRGYPHLPASELVWVIQDSHCYNADPKDVVLL